MLRTHTWSAFAFNYVLNFTYSPSCPPLLAEVNCVVVLVTQYEFRSHGVCVQRNKFLLTQPPPPWVTPGWEDTWGTNEHIALHLSGHKGTSSQEHLFREPLVPKCLCQKAWKSDFPSLLSCHFNSRFIYIRRKSRTFWGFPEVIPTDTTNRIF